MSALQKHSAAFAKQKTQLVAIAAQAPKTLQKLKQRLSLSFPVLSDKALAVIKKYGVEHKGSGISLPAIFMVGPTGQVEWYQVAPRVNQRPTIALLLKIAKGINAKYKAKTTPRPTPRRPTPRR